MPWRLVFTQVLILSTHSHFTVSCLFCQFPVVIKKESHVKETVLLGLLYYFCSDALVEPPAVMSGNLLLARIVADAGDRHGCHWGFVLVQRLSESLKLKSYALMMFFSLTWFPYLDMNETLWNAENWPFLALKWAWERRVACFLCDSLTRTLSSHLCLAQVIY